MRPVKIFISYAKEDKEVANQVYKDLKTKKADPWLDSESIPVGRNWFYEIKKNIEDCDFFLILLSSHSVTKKGIIQKELKIALDIFDEYAPNETFIIPVRIEDCTPLYEKLQKLQWVDLFPSYEDGLEKISQVIFTKSSLDDMVEIPAGNFFYGIYKIRKEIKYSFYIDTYPITCSEYENFIKDDGYSLDEFWSDIGRKWRERNNIVLPNHWENKNFYKMDKPVVGISYYEAEAYARWAQKRLPTYEEWIRAARGENTWNYPWGMFFAKEKCNTTESNINETTPVSRYPQGVSPWGCYDLCGNVMEWTSGKVLNKRIAAGGSWKTDSTRSKCTTFAKLYPITRNDDIGFRCAKTKREA